MNEAERRLRWSAALERAEVAGRRGKSIGPLLLWIPLLALSLWLLHLLETRRGPAVPALGERVDDGLLDERPVPPAVSGFRGLLELPGARILARLTPLHAHPRDQEFKSSALRRALGLPAGETWRLELEHHAPAEASALVLGGLAVSDGVGQALRLLVESVPHAGTEGAAHPLRTLYTPPARLAPGERIQLALWGRRPASDDGARRSDATLRLATAEGARLEVTLAAAELDVDELPIWFARAVTGSGEGREPPPAVAVEQDDVQPGTTPAPEPVSPSGETDADPRDEELQRLRAELRREVERRQEREFEWLEYNRALAKLDLDDLLQPFEIDPERGPADVALPGPDDPPLGGEGTEGADDETARVVRAAEIAQSINALMRLEGVRGYELLEAGVLESGAIGPVVFRLLDDRGRLAGSLYAERLHCEGSRAGKTLTFVLEQGHESRGGHRVDFQDGAHRIHFPRVDPVPWMEALPELFRARDLALPENDGLWEPETVRRELNRLLGLDVSAGWYRVQGLGGIVGDTLLDVHLEALDAAGRIERRFFADRLRLLLDASGVVLVLEGGAVVRGEEKNPFVGGTHRLFLPRARLEDWRAARLPGLSPSDPASQPAEAGEEREPRQR